MLFCGPISFYDDAQGHIVPSLDSTVRDAILKGVKEGELGELLVDGGVYVQAPGPRFETKAEVRVLKGMGDVIGMTAGSEATMAKELGVKYAMMCMVDNMANGLSTKQLTHEKFQESVKRHQGLVEKAARCVVDNLKMALQEKG